MPTLLQTSAGRVAAVLAALLVLSVLVGVVALWPSGDREVQRPIGIGEVVRADVTRVTTGECERWAGPGCRVAEIALRTGPSSRTELVHHAAQRPLRAGDRRRATGSASPATSRRASSPDLVEELPLDDPSQQPFAFVDFDRSSPLLRLGLVFAGLVVLLGRWHGVRALAGLGLSLLVVIEFLVPALLEGEAAARSSRWWEALAVMLVTIGLSHGVGLKSVAAVLGTATALALTAALALLRGARGRHHRASRASSRPCSCPAWAAVSRSQGLVVAGMVIGALGVLDDVTVSQASTVLALRRANPELGFRRLFGEALAVGRDHLGATVNTLVLAYAAPRSRSC